MNKMNKAQLFTVDLLIALVPITIALGLSANALSGLAGQVQDYAYYYDMKRVVDDAADILVKTPGEPPDWNFTNPPSKLGLAKYSSKGRGFNNIDYEKVQALNVSYIGELLGWRYPYFRLTISAIGGTSVKSWTYGSRDSVREIFATERIASMVPNQLWSIVNVTYRGTPLRCDYTCKFNNSRYYIEFEARDLSIYDYWLLVERTGESSYDDQYIINNTFFSPAYPHCCEEFPSDAININKSSLVKLKLSESGKYSVQQGTNYLFLNVFADVLSSYYVIQVPEGTNESEVSPDLSGTATLVVLEVGR
jgi:hypothetical protein